MKSKLLMATHNKGKVRELQSLLGDLSVEVLSLESFPHLPVPEETQDTFLGNALDKAVFAAEKTGLVSLADDSGLEVDALQGKPGVQSARFAGEPCDDERNNRALLELMLNIPRELRTARFKSVIAIVSPQGQRITAQGQCEGLILTEVRGQGGFGYDPLFYIPDLGKTMAELSLEEKNKISHRGQALREAVQKIGPLLTTE